MRHKLIAGNWKMNGTLESVQTLIKGLREGVKEKDFSDVDIIIIPSYIHLPIARALLDDGEIRLGAQNLYLGDQGAFTGEVSGPMLADIGCEYVLVGHSERRQLFQEDLHMVAAKFKAAIDADLTPILCIGETAAERKEKQTEVILKRQLSSVIDLTGIDAFTRAIIAYEPVWAIGTGLTADPNQADDAHAFIRELISQNKVELGSTIRILYGGSMKADNAAALLTMPNIDGGLIGGASLKPDTFLAICDEALSLSTNDWPEKKSHQEQ